MCPGSPFVAENCFYTNYSRYANSTYTQSWCYMLTCPCLLYLYGVIGEGKSTNPFQDPIPVVPFPSPYPYSIHLAKQEEGQAVGRVLFLRQHWPRQRQEVTTKSVLRRKFAERLKCNECKCVNVQQWPSNIHVMGCQSRGTGTASPHCHATKLSSFSNALHLQAWSATINTISVVATPESIAANKYCCLATTGNFLRD